MKKYFNFFTLVLLVCKLQAARIEFKSGNSIEVPDYVVIHNDLERDFVVFENDGWINLGHHLRAQQKLKLEDMGLGVEVTVEVYDKEKKYLLFYPTACEYNGRAVKGLISVFEYNLSDIVNGNKNAEDYTTIQKIIEYMSETSTLTLNK